jgi:hypothetical protein
MKQNKALVIGSVLLGGALIFGLYGMGQTLASGYYPNRFESENEEDEHNGYGYRRAPAPSPQMQQYRDECGSCHMAYPAMFLPAEGWQKIMGQLDDHFGENAELDEDTRKSIENFLVSSSRSIGYRKMSIYNDGNIPIRITELPGFKAEHREIPARFIQGNDKVGSLSQCDTCHRGAEQGYFDEDSVSIPGIGRWDD